MIVAGIGFPSIGGLARWQCTMINSNGYIRYIPGFSNNVFGVYGFSKGFIAFLALLKGIPVVLKGSINIQKALRKYLPLRAF